MNGLWLKDLSAYKDGLFDKLASPDEGWRINDGESSVDVPLNELDASAYAILQKTILQKKKVALAIPRVKIGVSLSIIVYLVVNRFLKQQSRPFPNLIPVQLNNGQAVVVATRNRKLRDFFLESYLRFSHTDFPFTHFPITRVNRLGKIIPLVNKTTLAIQLNLDPVAFYHFDDLDNIPAEIRTGCVIGELIETDSRNFTERLCNFIQQVDADSAMIFVNAFASNAIDTLKNNGFEIIALTNDFFEKSPIKDYNLPSLAGSLSSCASSIQLDISVCDDEIASLKLGRIAKYLSKLNRKIEGSKPLFLLKAWNVFYNLKDIAISLDTLEEGRKNDVRLQSLSFTIQQIFNTPISRLTPDLQEIFNPIWSSLGAEFRELYDHLKNKVKKEDTLINIVQKALVDKAKICIVFSSEVEAEIFKEKLIIEYGWIEHESNISVGYIDQLISSSQVCEHIVLTGIWRKASQAKLISLLPKRITVVCYTTELISVHKALNELNINYINNLKSLTDKSIQDIDLPIRFTSATRINLIDPDPDSKILIDHYKDLLPEDPELQQQGYDSFDWLDGEQEVMEDLEAVETGSDIQISDEEIPVCEIILNDGRHILVPTTQELYAYSENLERLESKLPQSLDSGDVILLYSEEQNQEMFKSVLQRTQELSKADPRIVSMWKSALKELREWYDINNPNSLRAYLHDLQDLGCNKSVVTVKLWLKGLTLAPDDSKDIGYLLELARYKNSAILSKMISSEINKVPVFHRELGKRLKVRLGQVLTDNDPGVMRDKIDKEIDELLETADIATVSEVNKETKYVSKDKVRTNVFG